MLSQTPGFLQNFIPIQGGAQKLRFTLFHNISMESICHTVASFEMTYANLIETIFQSIYKNLLLSYISLPHPKSFKSGGLLNF